MARIHFGALLAVLGCGGAPFEAVAESTTQAVGTGETPAAASAPAPEAPDGGRSPVDGGVEAAEASDLLGTAEASAEASAASDKGYPAADGGFDSSAEASQASDSGTLAPVYAHSDGYGDSWQDSTPPRTYSAAEAQKACQAYSRAACVPINSAWPSACFGPMAGFCGCWIYGSGTASGHALVWPIASNAVQDCNPGDVTISSPTWW